MSQAGYKNMDLDFWHILFAPAGTPQPIIDKLNAALRHAMADARVVKLFTENGMDLYPADQWTPAAASAMLKSEIKRWGDVVRANHIQLAQ
jgi:tripartite-type tricarboxylate transporter receptor subunit TctC